MSTTVNNMLESGGGGTHMKWYPTSTSLQTSLFWGTLTKRPHVLHVSSKDLLKKSLKRPIFIFRDMPEAHKHHSSECPKLESHGFLKFSFREFQRSFDLE